MSDAATAGAAPLFTGPEIQLGGVAYVLPPLSFGALEDCGARLKLIAEGATADPMALQAAFVDVIHAALLRNYPGLPRNAVRDHVDWDTAPDLFRQVMERSLPNAAPGETTAASPSGASTGP